MRRAELALLAALALFGCSSGDKRLEGARSPVFAHRAPSPAGTRILLSEPRLSPEWASVSGNSENRPGHLAGRKNPEKLFSRSVGKSGSEKMILYPPVSDGETAYAIDGRLDISAISLKDGRRLWKNGELSSDDEIRFGALALGPGALYALTGDGKLARLDPASGEIGYLRDFATMVKSGLQLCGDLLAFVGADGTLHIAETATGKKLAAHRTLEGRFGFIRGATPACRGERIVAAFPNGELHMVMGRDASPIWLASVARQEIKSASNLEDIVANPVIGDSVVLAKAHGGPVRAFDLKSGDELWSRPGSGMSTPALDSGFAFDVDSSRTIAAFDVKTGATIWETRVEPGKDGAVAFDLLLVNNRLLVPFSNGEIFRLNPYDGSLVSSERIAPEIDAPLAVAGDKLLAISNGYLLVFR